MLTSSLYDFEIFVLDYAETYEPDDKESVGQQLICYIPRVGQCEEKFCYPEQHVDVEQHVPYSFPVGDMQMLLLPFGYIDKTFPSNMKLPFEQLKNHSDGNFVFPGRHGDVNLSATHNSHWMSVDIYPVGNPYLEHLFPMYSQ